MGIILFFICKPVNYYFLPSTLNPFQGRDVVQIIPTGQSIEQRNVAPLHGVEQIQSTSRLEDFHLNAECIQADIHRQYIAPADAESGHIDGEVVRCNGSTSCDDG